MLALCIENFGIDFRIHIKKTALLGSMELSLPFLQRMKGGKRYGRQILTS